MSYSASFDAALQGKSQTGLPAIVKQALSLLITRRERARSRNRLRWELSQYSDRDLADLGFSRHDIEDVVQGRYQR